MKKRSSRAQPALFYIAHSGTSLYQMPERGKWKKLLLFLSVLSVVWRIAGLTCDCICPPVVTCSLNGSGAAAATIADVQFWKTENTWRLDRSHCRRHRRVVARLVDAADVRTVRTPGGSERHGAYRQLHLGWCRTKQVFLQEHVVTKKTSAGLRHDTQVAEGDAPPLIRGCSGGVGQND